MTRKPPRSAPAVVPQPNNDIVEEVRRYKLITPLFGGGVEPQKADPLTTVRASEIRGHLRFWWRATRGGQFNGELAKMKVAEEKIWGSAATMDRPSPSKVSVVISDVLPGEIRLDTERKGREKNKKIIR